MSSRLNLFDRLANWLYGSAFHPATHCTFCGDELVVREVLDRYDPQTGKAILVRRGDCPRVLDGTAKDFLYHPQRPSPSKSGQL